MCVIVITFVVTESEKSTTSVNAVSILEATSSFEGVIVSEMSILYPIAPVTLGSAEESPAPSNHT